MQHRQWLVWLVALEHSATHAAEGPQPVDETDCDCFLINGSNPTYYAQHMFFDFRSLSEFAGVPDVLTDSATASLAPPSSDYFSSDNWTSVWEIQSWDNLIGHNDELTKGNTVLMVNSPNNVFLEKNDDEDAASDTYMTMRTKRLPEFQTAAEFGSTDEYLYVSLRMLARTTGSPGAVTAMFTYRDAKELADVQESDIEFLTSGSRDIIHYTNQPSYSLDGETFSEATRNATVPDGGPDWTEWMVHRLDWMPDRCVWYVNGEETANISFQTPRDPSQIIFNAWSNGGYWSGNMSTYDETYLQIQWVEMVFNSTDEDGGSKKRSNGGSGLFGRLKRSDKRYRSYVCSIDEADEAGAVTMLWDNPAARVSCDGWLHGGWVGLWLWSAFISSFYWVL